MCVPLAASPAAGFVLMPSLEYTTTLLSGLTSTLIPPIVAVLRSFPTLPSMSCCEDSAAMIRFLSQNVWLGSFYARRRITSIIQPLFVGPDMCFEYVSSANATEFHRKLCGFELGPVLGQQGPYFLGQEFAEMAVDGQFPGQELDRILPFEAAQVRLVHEIPEESLETLRHCPGDFKRHGKVLRLRLPQPAQAVAVHDAGARTVRPVRTAAVLQRPEIDQHRPLLHDALRYLVRLRLTVERPFMAAGHNVRRSVLGGEIIHRPHRVDHRLEFRMDEVEHQIVAMNDLRRLARTDLDRLRQVQMIAEAALEQEMIHHPED